MGKPKVVRYFDEDEGDDNTSNKSVRKSRKKTITYDSTNVKPKDWKRKHASKVKLAEEAIKPEKKKRERVPVSKELLAKYSRGEGVQEKGIQTNIHREKLLAKEKTVEFANEEAARVEILLTENAGFLEADPGERTTYYTQKQILENVDIMSATKHFELKLNDFGPYRMKYYKNGRHLLIGGKMGHLAAFDWATKRLHFEINVMESVHDVCWLHVETMLAAAQKNYVYIYDNQGTELHCLKRLSKVSRMEFLPYHFLLATAGEEGYLSWLDISIGEIVTQYNANMGRIDTLTQNPYNAVLCVGNSKGVVSMWAPNTREHLAKMLCHKSGITAVHVDPSGKYMSTAGLDHTLKIWDIRKLLGPIRSYNLRTTATNIALSQKNMLAVGMGNIVEVYKDACTSAAKRPYIRHCLNNAIGNLGFCPYEDVLGVASKSGFTSLLVPGSGEPNFDAFEANPFQTNSQRREREVKSLLEKIQPELISLDPHVISAVDIPTAMEKIEAKRSILFLKPPKVNYDTRKKMKGKGGSVNLARNKKIVQEEAKKDFIKSIKDLNQGNVKSKKNKKAEPYNVLNRFLPKSK